MMLACTKNCGSCRRFDRAFGGLSASVPEYLMFVAIHSSSLSPLCFLHLSTSSTRISTCYLFYAILARQPLSAQSLLAAPFHTIPACHPLLHNSDLRHPSFHTIPTCHPLSQNPRLSPPFTKSPLVTPFHKIPACHPLSHNSHLSPRTCCGVCLVTRYLLKKPELTPLLDGPRNKCGVTSGECGVSD